MLIIFNKKLSEIVGIPTSTRNIPKLENCQEALKFIESSHKCLDKTNLNFKTGTYNYDSFSNKAI